MTQLSHEADMQPSLFERLDPPSPSEQFADVAELSHAIAEAAQARYERNKPATEQDGDPLDHTDEWLADTGGGPRKDNLMQNPPVVQTEQVQQTTPNTRGGRSYPEASDSELDPEWQKGQSDLVEPGSPQALNNIVQIESHRVDTDQRYFDQLQAQVAAGEITQSRAGALWRVRIEKSSRPRSA